MPVASCTASIPAPAHRACWTSNSRPSCGRFIRSSRSGTSSSILGHEKTAVGRSIERSAFCRASGKLRPIAMASPTLFMVVVKVLSAPGNFSNAKRGTLTTM